MTSILHGSDRTTPRVRAELQASQEATSTLAQRYGLSRTTIAKWRTRTTTDDAPMGPSAPHSTVLTLAEEAMVVEFRRRTLLPLDDVLGCLRGSIPKLTRSSLHRCLERHGISRLRAITPQTKRTHLVAYQITWIWLTIQRWTSLSLGQCLGLWRAWSGRLQASLCRLRMPSHLLQEV